MSSPHGEHVDMPQSGNRGKFSRTLSKAFEKFINGYGDVGALVFNKSGMKMRYNQVTPLF